MPVSYTVDTTQQLVVTQCEGEVTAEDLQTLLDVEVADERVRHASRHCSLDPPNVWLAGHGYSQELQIEGDAGRFPRLMFS